MGIKTKLFLFLLFSLLILFWSSRKLSLDTQEVIIFFDEKTESFYLETNKNKFIGFNHDLDSTDYFLKNGRLKIEKKDFFWESPNDWYVTGFSTEDITGDNIPDISLSVWKKENFGTSKPFWIKENDTSEKNHFFVFEIEDKTLKPLWQSSNLESPNCEFVVVDLDSDDKNELVTIEGEYTSGRICQGKYLSVWRWNGWGFSNYWRSKIGKFSNLKIKEINGKKYAVATNYLLR